MMASATNGVAVIGSSSTQEFQQPFNISATIVRLRWISPARRLFILGIRPGFLTMYAMRSAGSPPIG